MMGDNDVVGAVPVGSFEYGVRFDRIDDEDDEL